MTGFLYFLLHTERVVGEEECPLFLQTGATQLLLRPKQPSPPPTGTTNTSFDLSPIDLPLSPLSTTSSPSQTPSALSVQRSWFSMHQDLITSLSHFTSALQQHGTETEDENGSRTKILEWSLVQQNQVVEMLQKMVGSLESENERVREKVAGYERRVQALKMWKMRARLAEERLKEMAESSGILGSSQDGIVSFSALASFEKLLLEKDKKIASLQSRGEEKGTGEEEKEGDKVSVSLRAKHAEERVRVLELEEELLSAREEATRATRELTDCQSDVARRESEIQYLRHEVETLRKVRGQQQEVVMGLRTALLDRDAQIASLTRALEKTSTDRERRKSAPVYGSQSIFDLLLGREVFNIELVRRGEGDELGLSVSRFEMPISSRSSSLIVTAVKEGTQAQGLLLPGDEILEVNGFNCRSSGSQRKAVEVLERGRGNLKIVAARENGPGDYVGRLKSTPLISENSQSTLWTTANDASFSPITAHLPHNNEPPSSTPHHYQLSLSTPPSSASPYTIPLASQVRPQPIGQGKLLESVSPDHLEKSSSRDGESDLEDERLQRMRERQEQLEEELDTAHGEIENLKMEKQISTAKNFELQQQLKTSEREMAVVQRQTEEVQQLLAGLREKLEREKERASGFEQQISSLQTRLSEANSARDSEQQRVSQTQEEILQLKMEFERERSTLLTEMSAVQSRNEQLEAEVKSQLTQTETAQSQASEQEALRESEKKEREQLVQRLANELQELRESSARELSSLQSEVETLQNQLTAKVTQLETLGKRESEMKTELHHLRHVAGETDKQLVELDKAHRCLKDKMAAIREQAETKTLECESLTLGIKKAEGKLQANKNVSSRQQEEIDNLRRNNKRLLVERVKADEERSRTEVALKKCRLELAQAKEQLESQSGEKDLFSELETLVAENTALQQQLEDSQEKRELERLRKQVEQLQDQLDETRDSLQVAGGERDELQSELALKQSKTEELKQSMAVTETALEAAEAGKKKSEDLVSSMTFVHEQDQAKIRELEETLSAAQRGLEEIRLEATGVQEEMGRELQQLAAECAGLRERVKGLSEQLEGEKESRAGEVRSLREALQTSEQSLSHLQSELQARESANSINQATTAQLQTTCEQLEEEKQRLEGSLGEVVRQSHQLTDEVQKLQSTVRQLETDNASLAAEKQGLSESCDDMKSSLSQSQGKAESLTSRLETAMNELTVTQQQLEKENSEGLEAKKNLTELEAKYRESEKKAEGAESKVQEVTISLHRREEEFSQLKTQLEVSVSEQNQLQRSVALLQTTTKSQEKKIKTLEGERTNLASAVEQLKASQAKLKDIVTSLESEKAQTEETQRREVESVTAQLEEKVEAEREHLAKIQQLERRWRESQSTTEELLAAQEALRSSLTALGDEREGEVVRLREQLVSLETSLLASQQEASDAKTGEETFREKFSKTVEESEVASARCSELQEEVEGLREEIEKLRDTAERLAELDKKVNVLEKGQKERSDKIVTTERELETTSRELQLVKTENAALLERVGEVAAASLTLAETTAQLEKVRGELAAEAKTRREAEEEKEQLLGVLRRLEVEKHTVSVTPSEAASDWRGADREKLLSLATEKEEEAVRLREYVSKLLSAVVEKAPFLLERIQ